MGRVRRAYHSDVPRSGSVVNLDPEESHHVARVLRLRSGDALSVFDGRGREWDAEVVEVRSRRVSIRIGGECEGPVEPALEVILFQALCRPERMEWVIQKGTEVGLSSFHPIRTERVEIRDPSPERVERWRRIAVEACKQSGRRRVPRVEPVSELPSCAPAERPAILLDGGPDTPPLGHHLAGSTPSEVWVAVGPEGGFSPDEVARFRDGGWKPASLGPRTLRTETAGAVAGALILHAWGDLGRKI